MSCGIGSPKQLFRFKQHAEGAHAPTRALDPGGGRAPLRNLKLVENRQTGGGEVVVLIRSQKSCIISMLFVVCALLGCGPPAQSAPGRSPRRNTLVLLPHLGGRLLVQLIARLNTYIAIPLVSLLVSALVACAGGVPVESVSLNRGRTVVDSCGSPSLAARYSDYRLQSLRQEYEGAALLAPFGADSNTYASHRGEPPPQNQLRGTAFFSEPFIVPTSLVQCEAAQGNQFALSVLGIATIESAESNSDRERGLTMLRDAATPRSAAGVELWMCRDWSSSIALDCPLGGYIAQWALAYYSGPCGDTFVEGDVALALNAFDVRASTFLQIVPEVMMGNGLPDDAILCFTPTTNGVPENSRLLIHPFPIDSIVLDKS